MRLNIKNVTCKKNLNVELMVCKLMKIVILEDCIISWDEIECVTVWRRGMDLKQVVIVSYK